MNQKFFAGVAEVLSRVVSLILVLSFYVIFFVGKGNIVINGLVGQGALILGSIVLYELIGFVFYELFSYVEGRVMKRDSLEDQNDQDLQESNKL